MLGISQTTKVSDLLIEDFSSLLQRTGHKGEINPAAYDTAQVARVRVSGSNSSVSSTAVGRGGSEPTSFSGVAFPQALTWLSHHQHKDGSWGEGGTVERLLSTVAAIVALTEQGSRAEDTEQVERGIQFLWRALPFVTTDSSILPIGFELLIGALVEEGLKLNLNLPTWLTTHYEAYRQQKLSLIKNLTPAQFHNSTVVFSLEFLAGNLPDVPESFVDDEGGVGSSPSATASLIPYITDESVKARMLGFLKANEIVSANSNTFGVSFDFGDKSGGGDKGENKGSGWGDHSRFDIFEIVWVLYNLNLAGCLTDSRLASQVESLLDKLAGSWSAEMGVAAGTGFLPDSDDTAMAYILLKLTGRACEVTPIEKYWRKAGYLATYAYERDPSTSSNIHALEAYSLAAHSGAGAGANKTALEERVGQLLQFVTNSRHPNRPFWLDKWNASPYYPSAHAVIATVKLDPAIVEPTIAWMLYTQHPDDTLLLTKGSGGGSSSRNGNVNIRSGEGRGRGRGGNGGGGGWGVENPTLEETALVIQALVSYSEVRGWNERTRKAVRSGATYLRNHYSPFEVVSPPLWIGKNRYCPELVVKSTILSALLMVQKYDF